MSSKGAIGYGGPMSVERDVVQDEVRGSLGEVAGLNRFGDV